MSFKYTCKRIGLSVMGLIMGITAMQPVISFGEESQVIDLGYYNIGEQVIISVDGATGVNLNANSNASQNEYHGSGTMGADGTTSQTDGSFFDNSGLAQKQIVWKNFEQVIADLEKNGGQNAVNYASSDQTNVMIEGSLTKPQAKKIDQAVEAYKNLSSQRLSDPQKELEEFENSLNTGKDFMTEYIAGLYQDIADAYNAWSADHSSIPEISLTDTGFDYTLDLSDLGRGDMEITIPFSSVNFYTIPGSSGSEVEVGDQYRTDIPLDDGWGHRRLFCDYEIQQAPNGIYYIVDDEEDIYCLSMDDFNDALHCYFQGEDHPTLLDYYSEDGKYDLGNVIYDDMGSAVIGLSQREWWHYGKRGRESDPDIPSSPIRTPQSIGLDMDSGYRNIIIPDNSGLLVPLDVDTSFLFDPNAIFPEGLSPEDIQIENARILEELYKLLEESMQQKNGFELDPDFQLKFHSIEDWIKEHGDLFTQDMIQGMTPEEAQKYLQEHLGIHLTDALDQIRKTFEENKGRFQNPKPDAYSDEWTDRFRNFSNYASSAMEDVCDVVLYEQYQLDSVRYTEIDSSVYNYDERRWHIYLDGVELAIPITENFRHELGITPLEPGVYTVTAEQKVRKAQVAYVEYTVTKKLVEKDTGRLLYQVVKKGSNNNGYNMFRLGQTGVDSWVPTNDFYTFTVNDLGQIVEDDFESKVERVR